MSAIAPTPLAAALARATEAPFGLLGLGIPECPACKLLPPSLAALEEARDDLATALAYFTTPEDWALRETLLWPRGISVSRSSVPALALFRDGDVVAHRQGGAPAYVLDEWLAGVMGPSRSPLPPRPTDGEQAVLASTAPRRVQHVEIKGRAGS